MGTGLSEAEFKQVMPPSMRKAISPELITQVNATIADPVMAELFTDNLLGFATVIKGGKFTLPQYICAVKYVSFKSVGDTNRDAYIKAFPGKYAGFKKRGVSNKDISSYATAYNKSKLVTLIYAQTLVPVHILNAPMFQQALNVQAELMMTAHSEKVRSDAAAHLMTILKPPEVKKIELDVGVKEDDSIKQLRETTLALARQQRQMITDGSASANAIAASTIISPEDNDIEDAEFV